MNIDDIHRQRHDFIQFHADQEGRLVAATVFRGSDREPYPDLVEIPALQALRILGKWNAAESVATKGWLDQITCADLIAG